MTSRRDTLRERWTAGAQEDSTTTDPGPVERVTDPGATTDPGPAPVVEPPDYVDVSASVRNRSESEPIKVIFQKIAQRDQIVPRSVEQGSSRQAVHEPAPSRPMSLEPPVVVNISTDPGTRRAESNLAPTVVRPRRRVLPALVLLALLLGLVLAMAVMLVSRSSAPTRSSAGASPPTLPPSAALMTPPAPSLPLPATAPAASAPIRAVAPVASTPMVVPPSPVSRQPRPTTTAAPKPAQPKTQPGLGVFPEDL